jgi:hypothetical protein
MATTTRRHQITHGSAPFGNPDGAKGDLRDVQAEFIDLPNRATAGDLASRPDDRTVRVLVGKKGVGKTIYLRRFQASASREDSVFAASRETTPPATQDILRITQLYDAATATESWGLIWRRAIQRSVITNLLCRASLRQKLQPEIEDELRNGTSNLIPAGRVPRPIYAEVSDIIGSAHTAHKLDDYLKHRGWVEVEHWLARALHDAPPIYLYIDALDDHFQRAPMYWLKCQKGLFYEVMGMLEDEMGSRLHVVVCIRDIVLSSVLRGEHGSRYRQSPHIRKLEWDFESARFFLLEKIRRLDKAFVLDPSTDGIAGWLGRKQIYNHVREVDEQVEDYLLRHTRLIPRDIVLLGNALCQEIAKVKAAGGRELPAAVLRRVVGAAANGFADEQLRVCANQIAADQVPEHGARNGSVDYFIGSHEYSDGSAEQVVGLLEETGKDRFDHPALLRLAERGREELNGYKHLLDALWQNGLLGYDSMEPEASHAHFYASSEDDRFHLPTDKTSYVLHPCLPHRVRLEHTVSNPVLPYRKAVTSDG